MAAIAAGIGVVIEGVGKVVAYDAETGTATTENGQNWVLAEDDQGNVVAEEETSILQNDLVAPLAGAALGYMVKGPEGALIGAVAGYFLADKIEGIGSN